MHAQHSAKTDEAERSRPPASKPAIGGAPPLLALQRSVGNAAVVRMLRRTGRPGAQEEPRQGGEFDYGQAEHAVQRSTVQDVLRSPGRPLDHGTRTEMEGRLGADFSDVRIHTDAAARASAVDVGARAYTSGHHVVIGEGGGDKHTLAHELTHVIQQRQGPVAGTDDGTGLKVSDPSDRFEREAEANAVRVMRRSVHPPARTEGGAAVGTRTDVAVQRATAEEDREVAANLAEAAGGRLGSTEPWARETFDPHDTEIGADRTGVHIASVQAPTDKVMKAGAQWSAVELDKKKKLLGEALDTAFLEWSKRYDPEQVYIFTAPEYYFSGQGTHFLSGDQAAGVDEWLADRLAILPSNYLVVPGTIGRRRSLDAHESDQARADQQEGRKRLKENMGADNGYAKDSVAELEEIWEQGPDPDGSGNVTVFDNYARVFQGGQDPKTYTKRFEAPDWGGAPDRSQEEMEQGFFAIGQENFETTVKGVQVRLQICSDNAAESLWNEPYEGVHILVAANFGDAGESQANMHGDTFVVADSGHSQLFEADNPVPPADSVEDLRYHAAEKRKMTGKSPEATSTKGPVSLNFYRTATREPSAQ
ncbi:eCIS core domain-containing protein [Kitasatospora sp. NPDC001119]